MNMADSLTPDSVGEKVEESKERITIDDTRNIITKTEDDLRNIINSVLTRRYGPTWEDYPQVGWSTSVKTLKNNLKRRQSKFPEQPHSTRLLDYGYISDLQSLIETNEKSFESELPAVKKITTYLEILGENRTPIMHSEDVDEYQKHLCLGICGYLQQVAERWKSGYGRSATQWESDIKFSRPESMGEDAARKEVQKLADEAVRQLKRKAIGPITEETEGSYPVHKIPTKKGKLSIRVSEPKRDHYSHGFFQRVNINITFESYELVSEVLGKLPRNWTFTWIIPEGLDAIFTIDKIEQIGRTRISGSKTYIGSKLVGRGGQFTLPSGDKRTVRANIRGGSGYPTKITLVCDNGTDPEDGFTNAHEIFSPNEILAICYGERTPIEVLKLVDSACR